MPDRNEHENGLFEWGVSFSDRYCLLLLLFGMVNWLQIPMGNLLFGVVFDGGGEYKLENAIHVVNYQNC